jgi:catechol 2,3-dioxygenase
MAIDPALNIGSVSLAVGDLERSADFYERTLGLPLLERDGRGAAFGWSAEAPVLLLEQIEDPVPLPVRATGLFHVAWLHASRAALADTVRRIARGRWPLEGASDHGVSEALYLSDPDGLGIEIYADRPREQWEPGPDGQGVHMVTLPLDLEGLLAESGGEPASSAPADTRVGHVHLKVADVPRASAFYRGRLGLDERAQMPSAAFLAAGGYHHHVGLNSWQSTGAPAAPASAPALRRVDFALSSAEELERLRGALADDALEGQQGELLVEDPDGQLLAFAAA